MSTYIKKYTLLVNKASICTQVNKNIYLYAMSRIHTYGYGNIPKRQTKVSKNRCPCDFLLRVCFTNKFAYVVVFMYILCPAYTASQNPLPLLISLTLHYFHFVGFSSLFFKFSLSLYWRPAERRGEGSPPKEGMENERVGHM